MKGIDGMNCIFQILSILRHPVILSKNQFASIRVIRGLSKFQDSSEPVSVSCSVG